MARDLYTSEQIRYKAAGVLPSYVDASRGRVYVMFCLEQRGTSDEPVLHFLGGKRDASLRECRAGQTAFREWAEEAGLRSEEAQVLCEEPGLLSEEAKSLPGKEEAKTTERDLDVLRLKAEFLRDRSGNVFWCERGKYALFPFRCAEEENRLVATQFQESKAQSKNKTQALVWVDLSVLLSISDNREAIPAVHVIRRRKDTNGKDERFCVSSFVYDMLVDTRVFRDAMKRILSSCRY